MAQQLLYRADVVALLQQMGGKRVAKRMRTTELGDASFRGRLFDMLADSILMIMMTPDDSGLRVCRRFFRRENKLPDTL